MAPPSLPDHYASTFKYFLSSSNIKNTKTILRAYVRDIDGVYRRLSTAKNYSRNKQARDFFATLASTNAGINKKNRESK